MDNLFALSRQVLVTDGVRGIGRGILLRSARAGASVLANYMHNQQAADDLKATAEREGLRTQFCRADVTRTRGLEQTHELRHLLCNR